MSSLTRQFSWVLFGRVLAALIQALSLVILARLLNPDGFGFLTAVMGVCIVFQAVADLGISKMVIRERASGQSNGLVKGGLRLNRISTLLLGAGMATTLLILGVLVDSTFFLVLPLAISSSAEKTADTWLGVAIADGDAKNNTVNLVSRRLIALLVFVFFVFLGLPTMLCYTCGLAIAALMSVYYSRAVVRDRMGPDEAPWRSTLKVSTPYWVNTVLSQLRNLDVPIVSSVAGPLVAGYYSAASKLTSPLKMIPDSMATVVLPYATRSRNQSIKNLVLVVAICTIPMAVIYVGLALLAPSFVNFILGESYIDAIVPIQIVLIGLVFSSAKSLLSSVMQGRGYQKQVAIVAVITSVIILGPIAPLSIAYGAEGAAWALFAGFLSEFLMSVLILIYLEKRGKNEG